MITAIDTNVVVSLWDKDATLSAAAQAALDGALKRGGLVVAAPVFTELMACPGRDEKFLDPFFANTGIVIDWDVGESTWRTAGRAFQFYATKRRRQGDHGPRRILADFVIGAHAVDRGFELLTLDDRFYQAAFPGLTITRV